MTAKRGSGLTDKLYWRKPRFDRRDLFHCFKRAAGGEYISLCLRHEIPRSGGQAISRPRPELRCALCDTREAKRRGWQDCAE